MIHSPRGPSLRLNLMVWLAGPVAVVLVASVWLSWHTAFHQAMLIMNRDLTSSARMIAEQIRFGDGEIGVIIPPAALEIFSTDAHDEVAYAVFDPNGILIAGFPGLSPRSDPESATAGFDTMFRTESMHAVTLRQPVVTPDGISTVSVTVGETLKARNRLVRALWVRGFAEQAALVLAAAASIWVGISIELRPLLRLRRMVLDRSPQSVEPLDPEQVQQEIRPLVQALNAHMARLGAYLDRQQRFLDGAAHQMRTPLAILKTQIGVARRDRTPDQMAEVLSRVDAGLTSMTRVTNQLLTLGRVEHERARPATAPVDLREVLRSVVSDIAPRALDAGVDLVLDAESRCVVAANELLVREMVMNMADNAMKYAGSGTVATISARADGGFGIVTVSDTGPGIAAAERPALLRRFQRGRTATPGGSGLGLTIVSEIAQIFGGQITLAAPPDGRGFAISVSLPIWCGPQGTASTNSVV